MERKAAVKLGLHSADLTRSEGPAAAGTGFIPGAEAL